MAVLVKYQKQGEIGQGEIVLEHVIVNLCNWRRYRITRWISMNEQAEGWVSNVKIYISRGSCVDQAKVLKLPFTSVSCVIFKLCCSLVELQVGLQWRCYSTSMTEEKDTICTSSVLNISIQRWRYYTTMNWITGHRGRDGNDAPRSRSLVRWRWSERRSKTGTHWHCFLLIESWTKTQANHGLAPWCSSLIQATKCRWTKDNYTIKHTWFSE